MDNAADHPPVVDPMGARLIGRQARLDHSPLSIAQPKFVRHDPSSTRQEA
jgi:hypothetical protein